MSLARRALPQDASRRGWCPSLARPMPTGDGLLARVHPPLGILSVAQVRAVAEGARRFGNGHVDLTARGNLQIRGVRPDTACDLSAWLAGVGLGDVRDDGGPQRLTLTSPLARADVQALAQALEEEGRRIAGLPAKTLVAILGPGVGGEGADVLVVAEGNRYRVALAGGAGDALSVSAADVMGAVSAVLRAFAGTGRRRVHLLSENERSDVLSAGGTAARVHLRTPSVAAPLPVGLSANGTATILVFEAPFGRCTDSMLDRLTAVAEDAGASDIRTTPARGFTLSCDDHEAAKTALAALAAAGFITRSDDPRRAIAACPGAPACASGSTPVPEDAAALATAFAPFAAHGLKAHVSGCTKGCAYPDAADLTLVADHGRYDVVLRGGPHDRPAIRLTFEAALERVRRADPAAPLADAFRP